MKLNQLQYLILPIFLLLSNINIYAQYEPWTAKLIVKHPDGYTDTLYIGMDSAGGDGYQPGLDIIDTNFAAPIGIRSHDLDVMTIYNTSQPANMKKDIRNFIDTLSGLYNSFKFYVGSDSFPPNWPGDNPVIIKWDTNDLKYTSGKYKLWTIYGLVDGGYADYIDASGFGIMSSGKFSTGQEAKDSIALIFEQTCSDYMFGGYPCSFSTNNSWCQVLQFTISISFIDTTISGTQDSEFYDKSIKIFPNPSFGYFTIFLPKKFDELNIYNMMGKKIVSKTKLRQPLLKLNLTNYSKGVYFVTFKNKTLNQFIYKKIIIK